MSGLSAELRQLLAVDTALTLRMLTPEQAAALLRAYWEADDRSEVYLPDEIEKTAALSGDERKRLDAEVSRRVAADRSPQGPSRLREVSADRYVDFRTVGEGGMGIVYLTLDTELNRHVAFKVVRPTPEEGAETDSAETPLKISPPGTHSPHKQTFENLKTRFLQEAWVTGGMEHPGVAPVYELGKTASGIPYYTMRYIRGKRTWAEALDEAKGIDDRLDLLEPFLKVCDTIRYAHARGVIHRDLKPRNIALGEFGEAVVLDWGLAKVKGEQDKTEHLWKARIQEYRTTTDLKTVAGAFGTPGYMAPETLQGASTEIDEQSDVYSLGAILYETLTGALPHEFQDFVEYANKCISEDPIPAHERDPAVPEDLSAICARALMRQKSERFASVDVLAGAVRRWRTEGALERQLDELVKVAQAAIDAASDLIGGALLRQTERAAAACGRILALRPDHEGGLALIAQTKALRERGVKERESAARRKVLQTVGILLLVSVSIATMVVAGVLRKEHDTLPEKTQTELDQRLAQERLRADVELATTKRRVDELSDELANGFARKSESFFDEHRVGAARILAAKALIAANSSKAWAALAAAERKPTWLQQVLTTGVPVRAMAVSGETLFLALPGDPLVHILDTQKGAATRRIGSHDAPLTALAVVQGILYAGHEDGVIFAWDWKKRRGVGRFEMNAEITVLTGGRGGDLLFAGTSPPAAAIFDLTDEEEPYRIEFHSGAGAAVTSFVIAPDGDSAYIGTRNGSVYQWSLDESGGVVRYEVHDGPVALLTLSQTGSHVCSMSTDHKLLLWDHEDDTRLEVPVAGPAPATAFAVMRETDRLLVGYENGFVRMFELSSGSLLHVLEGFGSAVTELIALEDGTRFYSSSADRTIRAWRRDDLMDAGSPAVAACVSADESTYFVAYTDSTIRIRDPSQRAAEPRIMRGGSRPAGTMVASPAGTQLYTSGVDRVLRIWDVARGTSSVLGTQTTAVCALALAPDSDRLYVATLDFAIHVWDLEARRKIATLQGHRAPVAALAANGDATRLVSGDLAGRVLVWDAGSRQVLFELPVQARPITACGLSKDGSLIACASVDGSYGVWRENAPLFEFEGLSRPVFRITFDAESVRWRTAADAWGHRLDSGARWTDPRVSKLVLHPRANSWLLADHSRRLAGIESRVGLMIEDFAVQPASANDLWTERFGENAKLHREPWSK